MEIQIELAERLGFLYGEGGALDSYNKMLEVAPNPVQLDINRKYTEEEITDTQLKAQFGDEKGLDWWKKQGLQMNKSTAKELYRWLPLYGRRYPIYLEPLLGLGETLKSRVKENLGIDWDISWYDPLPRWEPCPEHDASKFPPDFDLYTINFKTAANTHQTSASNVWLSEIFEADPYYLRVWMNEETGRKKGLRDGDKVWVESMIAKVDGRVKLSQAIHPQVIGIAHGQGSWATSPFARKGINYASLIPLEREEHVNPLVSSQEWCTRVKVTKRS